MNIKTILIVFLVLILCPAFALAELKKEYYPNGQLKLEKNYKDGKEEGIAKSYYESGNLNSECNFKNGKLDGIAKIYHENGGIQCIDTYKKGQKVNRKAYDVRGRLEFNQDYPCMEQ